MYNCHPTSTPIKKPCRGQGPPKVRHQKGSLRWQLLYGFSDVRASFSGGDRQTYNKNNLKKGCTEEKITAFLEIFIIDAVAKIDR